VLLGRELLFASRLADVAQRAGATFLRVEDPSQLPEPASVGVILVDWGDRAPGWADALQKWFGPDPGRWRMQVMAFGPHTDLEAHREAQAAGIGPMIARSRVIRALSEELASSRSPGP